MTRTRARTRVALAALALATLALLVGSATVGAQQGQVVTATVQSENVQAPDELPGEYEADLLVTVEASGGQCLCESTQVEPAAEADTVVQTAFDPASYEIDWIQQAQDGEAGTHQQALNATFSVPEVEEDVEVTVDVEMAHEPGVHITSQSNPATVVLPVPDPAPEQPQVQGNASTQSVDEDGGEDADGVPGPGVAAATAALAALALARRRWQG